MGTEFLAAIRWSTRTATIRALLTAFTSAIAALRLMLPRRPLATRDHRPPFFRSDFAILIVIELFQSFRSFGNFLSINDAVMVWVEHGQQRRHRPLVPSAVRL